VWWDHQSHHGNFSMAVNPARGLIQENYGVTHGGVVEVYEMLLAVSRSLVDRPEDVEIVIVPRDENIVFRVRVYPKDTGKLRMFSRARPRCDEASYLLRKENSAAVRNAVEAAIHNVL
jgi:HJR/Mrr/RecB family endonuclease